jgi:hypothetical protein
MADTTFDDPPEPEGEHCLGKFRRHPVEFSIIFVSTPLGTPATYRVDCDDGVGPHEVCRFGDDPSEPVIWRGHGRATSGARGFSKTPARWSPNRAASTSRLCLRGRSNKVEFDRPPPVPDARPLRQRAFLPLLQHLAACARVKAVSRVLLRR